MYGLKEKTIGKLLVRLIKIDKNSDDGFNLLNWKLPGQNRTTMIAGDFAGRCHAVLSKRATRSQPGDMTIEEVNEKLDKLSLAQKEDAQLPIMEEFYRRMNADEMMWLIRIILRQMKVGATERTFFGVWHENAEALFNISSNLRRVCWELYDPDVHLEGEETDIALMQCFQPQLAQFQMHSFDKMVQRMRPTEQDDEFWIEDKLDGERMQLHMLEDEDHPGGKRFGFWSRKAKDYTYLYGNGFEDDNSALTRHLKDAFVEGVMNIILDGEMITWDPEMDRIVGFGTLKTAALSEQKNPFSGKGERPLFRVFDILYLNNKSLTGYTLRDRRRALEQAIKPVHRRLEIHSYTSASKATEIEPLLRRVVADNHEGLVLKNPRSAYRLNQRNDDWMKVKPEYMTDYGEALDCVVVGGYYGSGHRGGNLSSFMCGLRVDGYAPPDPGAHASKCWSFFKVGGGFTAGDYATIRHQTEGKWHDWDRSNPPRKYIELAGEERQFEQPDVWIKPEDSFVIEVKAASIHNTNLFRVTNTLRFPRFKRMRPDRDWKTAMNIEAFLKLKNTIEKQSEHKSFELEQKRKKAPKRRKKELTVVGATPRDQLNAQAPAPDGIARLLSGMTFFILSESTTPPKRSRVDIETLVKSHGGTITNTVNSKTNTAQNERTICVADKNVVKVATLQKAGKHSIVRPAWLFDCVAQAERDVGVGREALLLPWEPRHVFFVAEGDREMVAAGADEWGDGFARDVRDREEMRAVLDGMVVVKPEDGVLKPVLFLEQLEERGKFGEEMLGWMFKGCVVWFDRDDDGDVDRADRMDIDGDASHMSNGQKSATRPLGIDMELASNTVRFAGGTLAASLDDASTTHIVIGSREGRAHDIRQAIKRYVKLLLKCTLGRSLHRHWLTNTPTHSRSKLPRIVTIDWVQQSWAENTLLDEEREYCVLSLEPLPDTLASTT